MLWLRSRYLRWLCWLALFPLGARPKSIRSMHCATNKFLCANPGEKELPRLPLSLCREALDRSAIVWHRHDCARRWSTLGCDPKVPVVLNRRILLEAVQRLTAELSWSP